MAQTASKAQGRPTPVPTNKVIGGGVAGALVTFGVWIYNNYFGKDHPVPVEISGALTVVVGFIFAYYVSPSSDQTTQ